VLVGRHRVSAGRLVKGTLVREAERSWRDLSPVAAAPLRAPLAAARILDRWLDVGSSDRQRALRLDGELAVVAEEPRALPWPDGGCAPLTATAAGATPTPCFGEAAPLEPPPVPEAALEQGLDAYASTVLVRRDGSAGRVFLLRPTGSSSAWLVDDAGRRTEVPDVGAQVALGDLDGDGVLEVISGRASLDPRADSLRVDSWEPSGRLVRRYELPLTDIQAIAVCPWSGAGLAPLAVAAGDQLWVLR